MFGFQGGKRGNQFAWKVKLLTGRGEEEEKLKTLVNWRRHSKSAEIGNTRMWKSEKKKIERICRDCIHDNEHAKMMNRNEA